MTGAQTSAIPGLRYTSDASPGVRRRRAGKGFAYVGPDGKPLHDKVEDLPKKPPTNGGSTDVGDVSWVVPTVQVHAPTVAIGTPFHTWQVVAQGKSPRAHKAMVQAAKAMAGLGVRALTEPDLIAAAKADLNKRTTRTPYVSPLPDSVAPPLDMSLT